MMLIITTLAVSESRIIVNRKEIYDVWMKTVTGGRQSWGNKEIDRER